MPSSRSRPTIAPRRRPPSPCTTRNSSWRARKAGVEGVTTKRLHDAVKKGDLEAVRALLARRPEIVDLLPGGPSGSEIRALHIAVMARDVEMTRLLLEAGAHTRDGIWPNRDATGP